jgi:hypothetical protein
MSESTSGTTDRTPAQPKWSRVAPSTALADQLSVNEALALDAGVGIQEVYVGWVRDPVYVASRRLGGRVLTWDVAGVQLRARVNEAIQPLIAAGWELDGSATTAMRWDTSHGTNGQQYDGCWVRMRSRET